MRLKRAITSFSRIGPLNLISSIIDANERPNSMEIQTFDKYVAVSQQNVYNAVRMQVFSLCISMAILHFRIILELLFRYFMV